MTSFAYEYNAPARAVRTSRRLSTSTIVTIGLAVTGYLGLGVGAFFNLKSDVRNATTIQDSDRTARREFEQRTDAAVDEIRNDVKLLLRTYPAERTANR